MPISTPVYNLACAAIDTYVTEDTAAAEDLQAELRATRLASFDTALFSSQGLSPTEADEFMRRGEAEALAMSAVPSSTAAVPAALSGAGRSVSGAMTSGAPAGTGRLRDLMLDFLETDSVCFRVDVGLDGGGGGDSSERLLRKRQDKHYGPLVAWYDAAFETNLGMASGFEDVEHPESAYQAAEDAVDTATPWARAALQVRAGGGCRLAWWARAPAPFPCPPPHVLPPGFRRCAQVYGARAGAAARAGGRGGSVRGGARRGGVADRRAWVR